nr:MAG TPA: pentapeptide repeat protein [Caudoviricetes sp.]
MEIKIDIKSIFGNVLFSFEKENNTIKNTLVEATLNGANLLEADLRGANLRGADLRGANLRGAYLENADLKWADLKYADLRDVYLEYADLRGADLRDADLKWADLRDADLRGANLRGTDFKGADLRGADLSDIYYSVYTSFLTSQCPTDGSFIGWKKCERYIVKLKICEDAERSSSTSLRCRCSKAEVLEIQNMDGSTADITEICSNYNKDFIYKVGETVEVKDFDKCRWNECSNGIHFFIDRNVAVAYRK